MENRIDPHTLNVLQQALRTLTLSLAAATKADLHVLSQMLKASSSNDQLEPEARLMLTDLAEGMGMLATQLQPKPAAPAN